MKVTAKVNPNHLKFMKTICAEALVETADAIIFIRDITLMLVVSGSNHI